MQWAVSAWVKGWRERLSGRRPWVLWTALVSLLVVVQSLLLALTVSYEAAKAHDRAETVAQAATVDIHRALIQRLQAVQALNWTPASRQPWIVEVAPWMRQWREVGRLERRDVEGELLDVVDSPYASDLFSLQDRRRLRGDAEQACVVARRLLTPQFSRSYFVALPNGAGLEVMDLCLPEQVAGQHSGFTVASLVLAQVLEAGLSPSTKERYELSFVEADGTRLARQGTVRGSGVYTARRPVDLPGTSLLLKVDDQAGHPGLIPNLTTALVLSLSLALAAVVALLLHDMRRRSRAELELAESLAFRKAMENSLVTGLRARDLDGRIRYVNPAFCAMVGFGPEALLQHGGHHDPVPPYWPPERVEEYRQRQDARTPAQALPVATDSSLEAPTQQGFETVFLRANGERFPVMIYEAPLRDSAGRHTGWMSAVLDMSEQQRAQEQQRQQQERLQATARLATMGEMASLLSHELNQPLAAIASYAHGSLNLLQRPDEDTLPLLKEAVGRMAEQAERAGRVIKSVHDFVRRREQSREAVEVAVLLDSVLPLVRLQARKSGARVEVQPGPKGLKATLDRTMMEQVLLNLTRNAIQAMEEVPLADRVLTVTVERGSPGRVQVEVIDQGPGIPSEVAERLFTPFYTTRDEGLGLGLSLCRTVIEQHGSTLEHGPAPATAQWSGTGCRFRFSLPAA